MRMVEATERDGKLQPGETIVEPTSGNARGAPGGGKPRWLGPRVSRSLFSEHRRIGMRLFFAPVANIVLSAVGALIALAVPGKRQAEAPVPAFGAA